MKNIAVSAVVVISLIAGGFNLYVRIANPDLTETRLLLTHWREYTVLIVVLIVATFFTTKVGKS